VSSEGDDSSDVPGEVVPPLPHPGVRLAGIPRLIGRPTETAQIAEFLRRVNRRAGGLLLFSGEAGVGKTRILHEAEAIATGLGMNVFSVDCEAQKRGVAYAPWVEMIRRYVDSTPRERVHRTTRPYLSVLSQLVPELADRVWLFDPSTPPVEWDRQILLEGASRFWVALAEAQPLLLSMDNLEGADAGSLELLETLARACPGSPVGIVCAYRDGHTEENRPLQRLLTSLKGQRLCETSVLKPFDRGVLGELIGAALGQTEVPPGVRNALHAKTKGNPLYTVEWLQWLVDQGKAYATPKGWVWPTVSELKMPASVERTILARLGRLEEGSQIAAPVPQRLAVLPFANLSSDPDDEYFADGLTEELITVLSHIRELRVIARTSVIQYKTTSKSISQIGSELGVSSILEGSVRKSDHRIRITAQLIDAQTQEHSWGETYDRELANVFTVQAQIAKLVARHLKVRMHPKEQARLEARPPIQSDSYLAYLKGRTLLHTATRASLEAAKEQFRLAISLDPMNAAAYAALSDVTGSLGGWYAGAPRSQWLTERRRWAVRAVDLDPNLGEAHTALAVALWGDNDYAAAEKEFKRALALNPSYSPAHHWYAELLEEEARTDEALVQFALAEGADPIWPNNLYCSAWLLIWLGKLDEALVKIQKLTELPFRMPEHPYLMARYHLARSDLKGCLKELDRFEKAEQNPRWKPVVRAVRCALAGEKEEARALLRREETLPEFPSTGWSTVWAYCELGDLDACFRWMAKRSHLQSFYHIRLDPRLEPMRNDPRFQALLRRMNLV